MTMKEEVFLREITVADCDEYYHLLATTSEVVDFYTGTDLTITKELVDNYVKKIVEDDSRMDMFIVSEASKDIVGEVVVNSLDEHDTANIRIAIYREENFDKGYGSSGMRQMIIYAFENMPIHRLQLDVFAFNPRGVHVYKTLGFKEEGRRREVYKREGKYYDEIIMSILRHEYLETYKNV